MTDVTFETREIGSLAKPPWRVKAFAGRPIEEGDVAEAERWAQKLGLDGTEELVETLRRDELGKDDLRLIDDWSARYGLALQITFGDAGELLRNGLAELPVEGIGVDFYATHAADVPEGLDRLLLAGVVDARSSALEDPQEIADFVERLGVERVALVPNGDLQYVSEAIARQKLARLGAARTAQAKETAA